MKAWTNAWRSTWRRKRFRVGDYVLSGGELPAAIVVDAVTRLLPGAVGNEASTQNESFQEYARIEARVNRNGRGVLLDFPHYTRPAEYRGWKVPEVLIGGNHAEVAKWRRRAGVGEDASQSAGLSGSPKTARKTASTFVYNCSLP